MDFTKLIEYSGRVSATLVLGAVVWAGMTGMIVPGPTYKEMQADRDTWRGLALKGTTLANDIPRVTAFGTVKPSTPLPDNPTADQVRDRLDAIEAITRFKTEPTDKPL